MNPRRTQIRADREEARAAQKAYMPLEDAVRLSVALGLGSGVRRPEFLQRHLEAPCASVAWYWLLRAFGAVGSPIYLSEGGTPSARKADRATTGPHLGRLARLHRLRDLSPPGLPRPTSTTLSPGYPADYEAQTALWVAYRANVKARAADALVRSAELSAQPSKGSFDRRRARRRARALWLKQKNDVS